MLLRKQSILVSIGGIVMVLALIGVGVYFDRVLLVAATVGLLSIVFLGLWQPIIPLLVYIASIPFEDLILIDGIGSMTRGLAMVVLFCYVMTRLKRIRLDVFPIVTWAYLAIATASLFWGIDTAVGERYLWLILQQLVITLIIANMVAELPSRLTPIMWVYTLAAMATAAIAVFQGFSSTTELGLQRLQAFEGQSEAQFAAVLVPAILFALQQVIGEKTKWRRIALGLGTLLLLIAVLVSGTRSAWLGIVVAVFTLLPRMGWRQILAACLLLVGVYVVMESNPVVSQFVLDRSTSAVMSGGAGRLDIWRVGLTVFRSSPILGVGIGNFPKAFTEEAIARTPQLSLFASGLFAGFGSHNIYLGVLVELGVCGFLAFVGFMSTVIGTRVDIPGGLTVRALMVGYLVQGFFLDILNRKFFWLGIAMALGLRAYSGRQGATRDVKEEVV